MEAELSQCLQAATLDDSSNDSQPPAFFRLPLELRLEIYAYALMHAMSPTPEEIYLAEEPITRLPPASLYFVNRQIHTELREAAFAKLEPLILHATPQGALLSSFSETAVLAGKTFRDRTCASEVVATIWPPHPDRPVDIFHIWRAAREIQRQLVEAAPLQSLVLRFHNNELASWSSNGRILDTLCPEYPEPSEKDGDDNDITNLAEIFCRVRTTLAKFDLAPELKIPGAFRRTLGSLSDLRRIMIGEVAVRDLYDEDIILADEGRYADDEDFQIQEQQLERKGTRIAIKKLNEMTRNGRKKLPWRQWDRFMKIWNPNFETLYWDRIDYPWLERFCKIHMYPSEEERADARDTESIDSEDWAYPEV